MNVELYYVKLDRERKDRERVPARFSFDNKLVCV